MPKQTYIINRFEGGINDSADPRDIKDNELSLCVDLMVDEVGLLRTIGSNVSHDAPVLDNTGAGVTQTSGSGLFYFKHDRKGGEDAGDSEAETGDSYLALYDDADAQVWVYSLATDDWDDDKDSAENGVINFKGKSTSAAARPSYYSMDGNLRVSTGEFSKYDSGSNVVQTFTATNTGLGITSNSHFAVGNYLRIEDEILYVVSIINGGTDFAGSHTGSDDAGTLADSAATFTNDFLIGGTILNQTDGSTAIITDNTVTTVTASLGSGTDNNWDTNDNYTINNLLEVRRGMFGTKPTSHANGTDIYILNMNQWYGYINNKFFQDSSSTPAYITDKWYNNIQHLRSLDELGISLSSYDATSSSPTSSEINATNKIIVAYWFTATDEDAGFWLGSYWLGMTPIYLDGQEGPISTIGTSPVQIHKEILNVQLYITHPDLDDTSIATSDGHPLLDERIIGLKLYIKNFTSDEWFLLKEFDLLKGGEHGWETYNSDSGANTSVSGGNTLTGFWKTTTDPDSLSVAAPSDTASYDGEAEDNTCVVTLDLEESKGTGRIGTIRLNGFTNSPLYEEVSLSNTGSQAKTFNVINPGVGTHKFVAELLDENFNIMARAEREQAISDSGVTSSPSTDGGGGGGGSS